MNQRIESNLGQIEELHDLAIKTIVTYIMVTKAKSKEKIDGIVAAIMALDRYIRNQTEPQGSVYGEHGLLIL